jgi:hypothetical protein
LYFLHIILIYIVLEKLIQHVVDFEDFQSILKDEKLLKQYDVAFMVHGTTRAQAGSAVPLFLYNLVLYSYFVAFWDAITTINQDFFLS